MKILYIAPFIPDPPDKGERIRAYHQLAHLATEHEVHLACLAPGGVPAGYRSSLEDRCASVAIIPTGRHSKRLRAALGFLAGRPYTAAGLRHEAFDRRVIRLARDVGFDCVFVFSGGMASCARLVPGVPAVVDFVDADSELWRQEGRRRSAPVSFLCRLEAERLARLETSSLASFDRAIVVSEEEAQVFRRLAPDGPVAVISNGVDLERFAPDARDPVSPPAAVFVGTMDYAPNVDAVLRFHREILPLVRREQPALRFHVVGRDPTRAVRALGRDPGVTVTGAVSDVRPWLARATLAVAPFRLGRGLQNKVLEAMASGVPVVGTTLAFQGLGEPRSAGVRVAEDPAGLAHEIVAILNDPALRERCAREGRQYVERHHRWEDHHATLSRLLREVVEGSAARTAGAGAA